ncbi:hypothetical protein KJ742_07460 [Patescibacteria group bacterium]|nr:hypothetical protein [Patescibacteria group bacterium]MBU1683748.1 hypothetical protein [Patescibacteria group bacterium]MBU1934557.1 hypothetical protein [Patescibacteria group bacterium]
MPSVDRPNLEVAVENLETLPENYPKSPEKLLLTDDNFKLIMRSCSMIGGGFDLLDDDLIDRTRQVLKHLLRRAGLNENQRIFIERMKDELARYRSQLKLTLDGEGEEDESVDESISSFLAMVEQIRTQEDLPSRDTIAFGQSLMAVDELLASGDDISLDHLQRLADALLYLDMSPITVGGELPLSGYFQGLKFTHQRVKSLIDREEDTE